MQELGLKGFKPVNYIFGILFSLSIVMGFQCEFYEHLIPGSWKTWFFLIVIAAVATVFSKMFWDMIAERKHVERPDKDIPAGRVWFFSSLAVWVMNFIVFLGVYPGFFVYDAFEELNETVTRSFNDQHPLFHVLSMGAIIQGMHKLTGDYNISIAAFILIQMTVNAVILGFVIRELYKEGIGRIITILLTIYFGVFPVVVMNNLCSSKDSLFTGFMVLLTVFLRRYFAEKEDTSGQKKNLVKIFICSLLVMLYRSNGIYAMAVYLVFLIIYFAATQNKTEKEDNPARIKLLAVIASAMILYLIINAAFLGLTKAQRVGHREILTVPIMQLARVYAYDNESMSSEDKALLERYIPRENLMAYTPKCSDLIKIGFDENAFKADKGGFLGLWIRTGLKHPVAYLDALCMTGYGMWYSNATIDGYEGREVFTFTYGRSSYFGYETEPPGVRTSFIPAIDRFYKDLSIKGGDKRIMIVNLLFSPGFMLWAYVFMLGYFVYAGCCERSFAYLPALIVIMTCFIGPMSLVRYAFSLWILVPLSFADVMLFDKEKTSEETDVIEI